MGKANEIFNFISIHFLFVSYSKRSFRVPKKDFSVSDQKDVGDNEEDRCNKGEKGTF